MDSQVYRAPSIPKLNRTNISSPLIRGGVSSVARVQTTRFSFFKKPSLTVPNLGRTSEENSGSSSSIRVLANSLVETNRILVEIQNQLAIDFATRIAEDKKELTKIRTKKSKKRFADKEAALETAKSLGKGVLNQFNKVLAPAKSIFDKIIEFFKVILFGLVVNGVLDWLSKKENRDKVLAVIKFMLDHWKWILGTLIAGKLLGFLFKFVSVARKLKKLIDFFKKNPPKPGGSCGCDDKKKPPSGPSDPCAPVLNCIKDNPPELEAFAEKLSKTKVFQPLFALLPPSLKPKPVAAPRPSPTVIAKLKNKAIRGERLTPSEQNILKSAGLDDFVVGGKTGTPGIDAAMTVGLAAVAALAPFIPELLAGIGVRGSAAGAAGAASKAERIAHLNRSLNLPSAVRSTNIRIPAGIGHAEGGLITGKGTGTSDSIPAMLSNGEFIVRSAASKLFKPLLNDINENAGRLWNYFREGVTKLLKLTSDQKDNAEKFSKTLEDFNNFLKTKKRESVLSTIANPDGDGRGGGGRGGGPITSSPSTPAMVSSGSGFKPDATSGNKKSGPSFTSSPSNTAQGLKQNISSTTNNFTSSSRNIVQNAQETVNKNITETSNSVNNSQVKFSYTVPVTNLKSQPVDLTMKGGTKGTSTIIPINLPSKRITAQAPRISMPSAPAPEVPAISSVDGSNPYISLTPSLYGIFV